MRIARIISTAIERGKSIIKILGLGASDVQTVINVQPFGMDSRPPKGYRGIFADTESKEDKILIGVILESAIADEGEVRFHSEDSDGAEQAYMYLTKDGELHLMGDSDNAVRFSELQTAFDELKSDFNSFVNTYNAHVHPGVTAGGASTSPTPSSGSTTSADISPAKIDEIKTN
jgi:hypothetical protein